jgi:hypothetical protein
MRTVIKPPVTIESKQANGFHDQPETKAGATPEHILSFLLFATILKVCCPDDEL